MSGEEIDVEIGRLAGKVVDDLNAKRPPGAPTLKLAREEEKRAKKAELRAKKAELRARGEAIRRAEFRDRYRDPKARLARARAIAQEIQHEQAWVTRLRRKAEQPRSDAGEIAAAVAKASARVLELLRESKAIGYPILMTVGGRQVDPLEGEG